MSPEEAREAPVLLLLGAIVFRDLSSKSGNMRRVKSRDHENRKKHEQQKTAGNHQGRSFEPLIAHKTRAFSSDLNALSTPGSPSLNVSYCGCQLSSRLAFSLLMRNEVTSESTSGPPIINLRSHGAIVPTRF